MPSIVTLLLHPERRRPGPPPLRVDLRAVILGGMVLWTAGLAVTLVLLATGAVTVRGVATCLAGLVLGGVALLWERRHRSGYREGTADLPRRDDPGDDAR